MYIAEVACILQGDQRYLPRADDARTAAEEAMLTAPLALLDRTKP